MVIRGRREQTHIVACGVLAEGGRSWRSPDKVEKGFRVMCKLPRHALGAKTSQILIVWDHPGFHPLDPTVKDVVGRIATVGR
jgi:hypothetical protein